METAWGLFLYVLFWVVVVSAGAYLVTWLGATLFPVGTRRWQRVKGGISHSSSKASLTEKTKEKRYRKAA
jgi:hypothetical protein